MAAAEIAELERLLSQEEYQAVLDRIDALPASKILSPRVHYIAAEAAEALGDSANVELERSLFVLALRGLLSTGDGTAFNPFVVCHPSDEYDILATLGREPAGQSLTEREGRLLDVIVCADGRETCFDVTDVLVRPTRQKRSVKPRVPKSPQACQSRPEVRRPPRLYSEPGIAVVRLFKGTNPERCEQQQARR